MKTRAPTSTSPLAARSKPPSLPEHPAEQTALLAVTGMSPAILTETLWALAHENPAIIPDRVVVLTTTTGKAAIEKELFTSSTAFGGSTAWEVLRREILGKSAASDPRLITDDLRVITAPNPRAGRAEPLDDIRTKDQNAAAADFILEEVRRLVETPDLRLIVSIAGGRKTMGALLYACMTLLGRETDQLTHVLVSDPFDAPLDPKFYFPTQPTQKLATREGASVAAANARIDLAIVPFVPLRNLFERDLIKRPSSFNALVQRCRKQVAEFVRRDVKLTIWRSKPRLEVNGVGINLSALQQVLLLFLAERASAGQPPIEKQTNAVDPLRQFGEKLYDARDRGNFADWRLGARLPADFDEQRLRKLLNEIRDKLRDAGEAAVPLVSVLPAKGRFSLDLSSSAVTLRA
jgi:CRISPR-associated protein (TIGR02584 family)